MKHNKLFKAGQPMIFPHSQFRMFPTWPQFHFPLFFFWLDLMRCNLNFLHLLQNFQQTTWFSLKKPSSPKTPGRRCNSIVSCEKKRTLEKALRELCPQNHFLTYFVCKREDEKSQFFDNICRIHSKVIL